MLGHIGSILFAIRWSECFNDKFHLRRHIGVATGREAKFTYFAAKTAMIVNIEIEITQSTFLGLCIWEVEHSKL